jgi:hypothetical protein
MSIGGIVSGAADAAKRAAEAAAKAAAEAAAKAAAEAARKAAEAAKKTTEGAKDAGGKASSVAAEQAKDVFEDAKGAVSGAADKAKDVAGEAVDKAQKVAGAAAGHARGVADRAADVFEDAGDAVGAVGKAVSHAARHPGQVLDKATDVAAAGLDKAGHVVQDAPTADPVQKLENQIAGGLLQTAADVVRDPVETAKTVHEAASINEEVDDLEPGEHVKVGLSAEGDAATVGLKGKGNLEVKRNTEEEGGGYTVSVDGEVGLGLVGKLEGTGVAEVGGSAFLNGGARAEFTFDTAKEAKQAADIIARSALVGAAGAGNPTLAPVTGATANQVLGDPLSDLAGLREDLSAVEVKLSGEAEGSVGVGVDGLDRVATAGAGLGVNAQLSQTARLEFENGQPSTLSVKATWQVGAQGQVEAGLGVPTQGGASGPQAGDARQDGKGRITLPTSASAGASGSFKAELEQSFELPQDFKAGSLLRDPAGTTREVARTANATREAKLTLTDSREASAQALGFGGETGQEIKVELSGNVQDIANSGALERALQGDLGGALQRLEGKVDTQASIQQKTTETDDVNIGFHGGAGGGEVGFSSQRTHLGDQRELTARQLTELYLSQRYAAPLFG